MKDKKTNRVNVSVDINGGSPIDNIIISDNNELTLPAIPTKDDYTFTGYEFDEDKIASNGMTVSKDVVLKAMWIDNDEEFVTVTFSSSQGESTKIKFAKESTLKLLELSLRDGYVFGGWVCNNSSHYMYTEEEAGGAMMWCVPTTSVQKSNTCPSGYSLKDNKCIKTESVNCTTN